MIDARARPDSAGTGRALARKILAHHGFRRAGGGPHGRRARRRRIT